MITDDIKETAWAWTLLNNDRIVTEWVQICNKVWDALPKDLSVNLLETYFREPTSALPFTNSKGIKRVLKQKSEEEKDLRELLEIPSRSIVLVWMDLLYYAFRLSPDDYAADYQHIAGERNDFYKKIIGEIIGERSLEANVRIKRNFYGITSENVLNSTSPVAFKKPGQDKCRVSATTVLMKETELEYPIKCGISGSAGCVFWFWFKFGAALGARETRLFLILLWVALCLDGGHSLQEVIAAFDIYASYLRYQSGFKVHREVIFLADQLSAYNVSFAAKQVIPPDSVIKTMFNNILKGDKRIRVTGIEHALRIIKYAQTARPMSIANNVGVLLGPFEKYIFTIETDLVVARAFTAKV